jgi:trans-2,3-dihydro-3-hydroxyanthranilate isomerase
MRFDYHTLDVFTDRVFGGNPLAVFPDGAAVPDALMQPIARELNLSETVFILPPGSADGTRRVRIFTPGREVPFAGHPTVGTAFFLVATGAVPAGDGDRVTVVLEEGVGPVPVEVTLIEGRPVKARLTAAVAPSEARAGLEAADLARLLGLEHRDIGAELPGAGVRLEAAFASAGLPFLVVPVRDVAAVSRARLDTAAWRELLPEHAPSRMVYVVAPAEPDAEVHARVRMFAPDIGVPEDPATGSAAAALGGYLGRRAGDGEHGWELEQGVEMGRPARLTVEARVEGGRVTSIQVGGAAVLVGRGTLDVPG